VATLQPSQAASQPRLAQQAVSAAPAPKPWVFQQPGAASTVLIGCILPFEGDLQLTGKAVYHALRMAITEEAPRALPNVNANLTCANTQCSEIPAHRAMVDFADDRAGARVCVLCCRCGRPCAAVCCRCWCLLRARFCVGAVLCHACPALDWVA
jgi:hypothetical protein